ncbi:ATP-binding protein [Nocardia sp. NPDC020380]|uniref:ATP-binding protein n=1 Tax=Nocardia sp. NPDC020380 TaxID=3364309 RepID=UPI0037AA7071
MRRWSGREVRALREARRMSVREFARHLGVSDRLVSKWESGGETTFPRPVNQALLDRSLSTADDEAKSVFAESTSTDSVVARDLPTLCQLMPDIQDFTGRTDEVHHLGGQLESDPGTAVRLVAVHGTAGVGKTTLVTHVAHRVRHRFPDGQLYVNLRGAQAQTIDANDALERFLHDLGSDVEDLPDGVEDRARLFRAELSGRRMLVVLDNAGDEEQVRPLLPGSGECAVLVTSRRRLLGLAGVRHVPLGVMSAEQSVEFLATVIGSKRVAEEPDAAREIVRLCGRLPLALRIVGARLASRPAGSLTRFADRLRDEHARLDVLRAGDLEVRASLGLSYESCSPEVRYAFRLLGMLEASEIPTWALALLADVPIDAAETLLEELVDAELVEPVSEAADTGRYRLHDLLRLFARERLEAEETTASRVLAARRLLHEYTRACEYATSRIELGGRQAAEPTLPEVKAAVDSDVRAWFRAERSGLVTAVTLANDLELRTETWQLAEQVGALLQWQSGWNEWEQVLELGLTAAVLEGETAGEARIRCSRGLLRRAQGRFGEAIDELQHSAMTFVEVGDDFQYAVVQRQLGDTFRYTGRLRDGVDKFSAALTYFETGGNPRMTAGALNGLGDIYRGLSRWDESTRCLNRAIDIYAELGDQREHARALVRLGIVWRDRCRYDHAEDLYMRGLQVFRQLGDRRWEARAARHLGILQRNRGRVPAALEQFAEALTGFESLADHRGVAVTLRNIGDAHRIAKDLPAAEEDLSEALRRFLELGDLRWEARTRMSLAGLDCSRGRYETSESHLEAALATLTKIDDRPGQARALHGFGVLRRGQERYDDSLRAFARSRDIFIQLGDEVWAARLLAGSADTMRAADDLGWQRALAHAEQECVRAGARTPEEVRNWLLEW